MPPEAGKRLLTGDDKPTSWLAITPPARRYATDTEPSAAAYITLAPRLRPSPHALCHRLPLSPSSHRHRLFNMYSEKLDEPYSHHILEHSVEARTKLKLYARINFGVTALITLTIWAILSIYWGTLLLQLCIGMY